MGKNVDYKELQDFVKKMEKQLSDANRNKFLEDCVKELAARLLSRVIKRTPVKEGNLRRSWTASDDMKIEKVGGVYQITIENTASYASYVEFGHRRVPGIYIPEYGKSTTAGWTDGKFMLTISENEVNALAPALLEKRLMEYLRKAF